MELWGYAASILIGLILGLTGGGGSVLTVPILIYLFKIPTVTATGYSLFIVGLTALVGSMTYFKNKLVNFKVGLLFAGPGLMGTLLSRKYIVPGLPDPALQIATFSLSKSALILFSFSIIMILAAIVMIRSPRYTPPKKHLASPMNHLLLLGQGLIVGVVTGFVGAGGGFLIIPALVFLAELPMKMAIGTSLFIISMNSLIGFLGDIQKDSPNVDWGLLSSIATLAIIGILVGSRLSHKSSEAKLKKGFGWFVLVMGLIILVQQL